MVQEGDLAVMFFSGCDPLKPMEGWTTITIPWWKRLWWKLTNGKPVYVAIKVLEDDPVNKDQRPVFTMPPDLMIGSVGVDDE